MLLLSCQGFSGFSYYHSLTINLVKKKCSSQEKTLERLSESLHLAIQKTKVIPKCADWNYVKVFNFSIFN
jgi:hypothetical protein